MYLILKYLKNFLTQSEYELDIIMKKFILFIRVNLLNQRNLCYIKI